MWAYFGGKKTQSKWLQLRIPYDIETYVEPFGGAFWVYFSVGFNSPLVYPDLRTIVYNDFSKNNVNLFRCCKDKEFSKYVNEVEPGIEDTYREYRQSFLHSGEKTDLNDFELTDQADFERGRRYIYVMTHTFSGLAMTSSQHVHEGSRLTCIRRFHAFQKRLANKEMRAKIDWMTIENLDYSDVIEKYDAKSTFFYIDPPYLLEATYSVDTFEGLGEHKRLADQLKKIQGRFILSYYHFSELDKWFPSCYNRETKEYLKMGGRGTREAKKGVAEELIIMNY